jgi:hypothetical protein
VAAAAVAAAAAATRWRNSNSSSSSSSSSSRCESAPGACHAGVTEQRARKLEQARSPCSNRGWSRQSTYTYVTVCLRDLHVRKLLYVCKPGKGCCCCCYCTLVRPQSFKRHEPGASKN